MRKKLPLVSALDIIAPKLVIPLTVLLKIYSVTWIISRAVFLASQVSAN